MDYEDEDEKFTFFEGLSRLWPGVFVVPLVSILSTISVAKAFSKFNIIVKSIFFLSYLKIKKCVQIDQIVAKK